MATLRVEGLVKTFGGLRALDAVSMDVPERSIVGLIGPNGSGKTTLINTISGLHKPDSGAVWYGANRIDGLPAFEVSRRGIGRTFQTTRLFQDLTALENVLIAGLRMNGLNATRKARSCLDAMGIGDLQEYPAGTLSVGQQRLLDLAMNLMADPDLWLLDEPVAGVHPRLRTQIAEHVRRLRAGGKTFLIIEHDVPFVLGLCDRIVVLHLGRKIADGPASNIVEDRSVLDAYLGRRALGRERGAGDASASS